MNKEFQKRIISSLFLIPITLFFVYQGSIFFVFFLSLFFILACYEWLKMNKEFILIKICGIIFFILSFYSVYLLRNDFGFSIFICVILICIFTDVGGYTFGKIFKGPKLTKISPNKTYSGVIGSFIISLIIVGTYINYKIDINFFFGYNLVTLVFILLISFVSQLGDLIISYFKRKARVKDTGKILPGHGGLLDRIDGMIFAFPFSYVILSTNILQNS